jgi:tRNA nucleotidyltransferase/poly(A) polymerase
MVKLTPFLISLKEICIRENLNIYLVGGAVRDNILGLTPKDYDFVVTNTSFEKLTELFNFYYKGCEINNVGAIFGIIKLKVDDEEYDFALPRKDIDRDNVTVDSNISIEEDLSRRDFTINSVAYDLKSEIYHYPSGLKDQVLKDFNDKVINCVGNPNDRFKEDPLRMLRAIQFCSRFGFKLNKETEISIINNVELLKNVSSERFYEEFYKGIVKSKSKSSREFIQLLHDCNIGSCIFGNSFNPISIEKEKLDDDVFFKCAIISMFLNGGDFKKIILENELKELIAFSRILFLILNNNYYKEFSNIEEHLLKIIFKNHRFFDIIFISFICIEKSSSLYNISNNFEKMLSTPVVPFNNLDEPYELKLSTGEILNILKNNYNIELVGSSISSFINRLINNYQKDNFYKNNNIFTNILEKSINVGEKI